MENKQTNLDLGMALERKKVIAVIEATAPQIRDHILKLILFPDNSNANHWAKELSIWISSIRDLTLKPDNKKLNAKSYSIYLITGENFRKELDSIYHEYAKKRQTPITIAFSTKEKLHEVLIKISEWAAQPVIEGAQDKKETNELRKLLIQWTK